MNIMRFITNNLYVLAFVISSCSSPAQKTAETETESPALQNEIKVGDPCEDCELIHEGIPETSRLSSITSIAADNEPGERMEISGTIYRSDGVTPAAGIILYIYHTDANGLYSAAAEQKYGKAHGHLRGWVLTDNKGQFLFSSIRPAHYPNAKGPAHIHAIIKEPGKSAYRIDEFLFEDDPKLSLEESEKAQDRGGSGIIRLIKKENGVWVGHREIVLGLNVPDYK
jgi:protocatechuate 3,4-dioxygenase, beta subunit